MKKREFYIYKEDLIKYKAKQEPVRISQMVEDLNNKFCLENMKKLRTTNITNFLLKQNYLCLSKDGRKRPTSNGKLLGIQIGQFEDENGNKIPVNLYNIRAQQYILDKLYQILADAD